ncbi:MAG: hypothetical protein WC444_05135 [Candidatus Paceibacterota bacterium]
MAIIDSLADFAPSVNQERLTFRRFDGLELAKAAEKGTVISPKYVTTVTLLINPTELSWSSTKLTNKVPSNSPGRFIVFNWGNDLDMLNISGTTGNMDPATSVANTPDQLASFVNGLSGQVVEGFHSPEVHKAEVLTLKTLIKSFNYFQLLDMSPKYRTFKKLQEMYKISDPDSDVVTLEMCEQIYRGYFSEFRFQVQERMPWVWTYNMSFIILQDLALFDPKQDGTFPTGADIRTK